LHNGRQKEPGKTIEESSGCVRPELDNKWPNAMMMMMMIIIIIIITIIKLTE
jgi:hypothetical protein